MAYNALLAVNGPTQLSAPHGGAEGVEDMEQGTIRLKTGLAEMLKGGVIMDVTTPEQAKIAEEAGACAVMALERVPADIRARPASAISWKPASSRPWAWTTSTRAKC